MVRMELMVVAGSRKQVAGSRGWSGWQGGDFFSGERERERRSRQLLMMMMHCWDGGC